MTTAQFPVWGTYRYNIDMLGMYMVGPVHYLLGKMLLTPVYMGCRTFRVTSV